MEVFERVTLVRPEIKLIQLSLKAKQNLNHYKIIIHTHQLFSHGAFLSLLGWCALRQQYLC